MTIKQKWEQCLEDEEYLQTLGNPKIIIIKMRNQSVSIATYMDTQQRNAEDLRRIKKQENVTNMTKEDIWQKIADQDKYEDQKKSKRLR